MVFVFGGWLNKPFPHYTSTIHHVKNHFYAEHKITSTNHKLPWLTECVPQHPTQYKTIAMHEIDMSTYIIWNQIFFDD